MGRVRVQLHCFVMFGHWPHDENVCRILQRTWGWLGISVYERCPFEHPAQFTQSPRHAHRRHLFAMVKDDPFSGHVKPAPWGSLGPVGPEYWNSFFAQPLIDWNSQNEFIEHKVNASIGWQRPSCIGGYPSSIQANPSKAKSTITLFIDEARCLKRIDYSCSK